MPSNQRAPAKGVSFPSFAAFLVLLLLLIVLIAGCFGAGWVGLFPMCFYINPISVREGFAALVTERPKYSVASSKDW